MCDWFAFLGKRLDPKLEGRAKATLAAAARRMFERRANALRETGLELRHAPGDVRELSALFAGLYRIDVAPRCAWIFDAVGGPPRGIAEPCITIGPGLPVPGCGGSGSTTTWPTPGDG